MSEPITPDVTPIQITLPFYQWRWIHDVLADVGKHVVGNPINDVANAIDLALDQHLTKRIEKEL